MIPFTAAPQAPRFPRPMLHPATLLLAWAGFAVALAALPLQVLGGLLIPVGMLALYLAAARTRLMLRRARWLLLSIAILFSFATPGLLMPGVLGGLGMTQDGLILAAEHVSRLLLLLMGLALLHQHFGSSGFVAGLYWLLAPLAGWEGLRERIVVRLMLVIEFVENDPPASWRAWLEESGDQGPDRLTLSAREPRWVDLLGMSLVAGVVLVLTW